MRGSVAPAAAGIARITARQPVATKVRTKRCIAVSLTLAPQTRLSVSHANRVPRVIGKIYALALDGRRGFRARRQARAFLLDAPCVGIPRPNRRLYSQRALISKTAPPLDEPR